MKKQEILKQIRKCIYTPTTTGLDALLAELIKTEGVAFAAEEYTKMLLELFTHAKADACAMFMQVAIRADKEMAAVNFPDNPFFRLAIFKGSPELYECYLEEYVLPFLAANPDQDPSDVYVDLESAALLETDLIERNYQRAIKGVDYNGAYLDSSDGGTVLMHNDDYAAMDNLAENFNSIVGRWEILRDLNKRGMD